MKPRFHAPSSISALTKSFHPQAVHAAAFFATILSFAATASLNAASATWNGTTDAVWASGTNWSTTPVPGTGDTATFNNAGGTVDTIDLGTGLAIKTLIFDTATAAAYTLGSGAVGSQTLGLDAAGAVTMGSAVATNQLINANLNLGTAAGPEAFTITNSKAAASNNLTLAGGVSTTQTGAKSLTVTGTGVINISGAITNGSGTLALTKTGANVLTLSGNNNYSGGTTITGIVNAASSTALGTGAVTVNAASGNQLQLGNGVNIANALTLSGGGATGQGVVYVPAGNATYSGTISATTQLAGGHFSTAGYVGNALTIAGNNTITNTGATPITIRNGTVIISGSQNYTGGTSMNGAAFVQFGKTTSMPSAGTVATIANGLLAANAGGAGEFTGGTGAGTIGGLLAGTGGQGAPVTWLANTTMGIDTTNATANVTHSSAWTPSVAVGLIKLGAGTLELTGGGTYASTATITGFPFIARQGTLLLNGGTHNVTGEAVVGGLFGKANGDAGLAAKLQVDSGTLAISGFLSVGRGNGIGGVSSDMVANNSAIITAANLSAGFNGGNAANLPKGSITLNGTSSLSVVGVVHIGESSGSNMTLTLNDNATFSQTSTSANQTNIATGAGANGTVVINGGTFNAERDLVMANAGGNGTLTIAGGILNVASATERWFKIGQGTAVGGTNTVTISSGTMNLNTNSDIRFAHGTFNGTSTFTISGGTIQSWTGNKTGTASLTSVVDLDTASAAATSTFNLNGGTLAIGQIITSVDTGTATFNFNGGTLKAAGTTNNFVDLGGANQKAYVQSAGANIDTNGFNVAIPQILLAGSPSGGLTKTGTGNLTLSAVNTYTGATLISGDTLTVGATGDINTSSGVTINGSDAKLLQNNTTTAMSTPVTLTNGTLGGTGNLGAVTVTDSAINTVHIGAGTPGSVTTINSLTFNDTAKLALSIDPNSTSAVVSTTNLNSGTAGGGKVTIDATSTSWLPGQYDLISYTGPIGGGGFTEFQKGTITGLSGRQSAVLTNPAGVVALTILGDNPKWTGAANGNWSIAVLTPTKNWGLITSGSPTDYVNGDIVLFDDSANTSLVNISSANVTPLSTTFANSTLDYEISSTGGFGITGTGSLTLNGTASVDLKTANTYSGGTFLNAGTLKINNASAIGTGAFSIANGTTIDNTSGAAITLATNNAQNWNGNFSFIGSNDLNLGTGAVTLSVSSAIDIGGSGKLTVGGAIGGAFGIGKTNTGTLSLSGTNTYTGITSVSGGTLAITGGTTGTIGAALEIAPALGDVATVNLTGGTLNDGRTIIGGNNGNAGLPGAGTLLQSGGTINTAQWFTVGSGNIGTSTTASGVYTMSGGVLNASTVGTQNMEVANFADTTGVVTVSGSSAINLCNNAAIAMGANNNAGNGTFNQNGGTVTFYSNVATTVGGTGALRLGAAGTLPASSIFTYSLNGGTLTVPSITRNAAATNLSSSIFNFNGGTLKATAANATFMQTLTAAKVLAGGAVIDDGGFALTIAQPLLSGTAGDGGLTKNGAGALTLTGVNTYNGPTTISAGSLTLGGTADINGSSGISINGSGAKFVQAGTTTVSPAVSVTNGTVDGAGALSNITVANNAANVVANGNGGTAAMTVASLAFADAATMNVRVATTAAGIAATTLDSGAAGGGKITVNATNASWTNGQVYNLVSYSTLAGGGFSEFVKGTITGLSPRQIAILTNPAGNIALSIVGDLPVWTGGLDGEWSTNVIGSPKNWKLQIGGTVTDFIAADNVVFDDSATGTTTINIAAAGVNPTSTTFNNTSKDYTLTSSAAIGIATGALTKNGTGKVTVTNTNTSNGAITINSGTLQIGDGVTDGSIATSSGITNNANLVYNLVGARTYANVIGGTGILTKDGAGTLTLTGINTYSGGTTVTAGGLTLTGAGSLGTGTVSIATAGTLNIAGNVSNLSNTFTGAGNILNTASTAFIGNFSGFTGTYTHNNTTVSTAFNSATATSKDASYVIASVQGGSQGMIAAGNGDYTLEIGSLTGVATSLFRGGNTATGTTTLQIGNLGTSTTFAGIIANGATKTIAVTKVGSGTLSLSGVNTYTGKTTVTGGTLAVSNASLADAADLSVGVGASMALNFTGSDTVNALTIDGTLMPAGTYGAPGSGATHTDSVHFSGTGVINATTGATSTSAYADWASTKGLTAGVNDGATQDPDNDGISNALEFVLGGHPLQSGTSILPTSSLTTNDFIFTFNRADESEAEIATKFQSGSDFNVWNEIAIGTVSAGQVSIAENGTAPDTVVVTIPRTSAVGGKLFGRLKAVK